MLNTQLIFDIVIILHKNLCPKVLSRRRWSAAVIGPGGPSMAAVDGPPTNITSNVFVVLFIHFYVVSINLLDATVSDMNL